MAERGAKAAIHTLLERRGPGQTLCPSEAARLLAEPTGDWRAQMDAVQMAVDAMLASGAVDLSWNGERLSQRRGAYRIARRQPADQG